MWTPFLELLTFVEDWVIKNIKLFNRNKISTFQSIIIIIISFFFKKRWISFTNIIFWKLGQLPRERTFFHDGVAYFKRSYINRHFLNYFVFKLKGERKTEFNSYIQKKNKKHNNVANVWKNCSPLNNWNHVSNFYMSA